MVSEGAALADGEAMAVPIGGGGVLLQDVAFGIADGELEALVDGDAEGGGAEAVVFGGDGGAAGAGVGEHGPGGVLGGGCAAPHADAEDVVAEGGDFERDTVGLGGEAVGVGRQALRPCRRSMQEYSRYRNATHEPPSLSSHRVPP